MVDPAGEEIRLIEVVRFAGVIGQPQGRGNANRGNLSGTVWVESPLQLCRYSPRGYSVARLSTLNT